MSADAQSICLPLVPLGQRIQPTVARRSNNPLVAQKSFDRWCFVPGVIETDSFSASVLIPLSPACITIVYVNHFITPHSVYRNTITSLQPMLAQILSGLYEFEMAPQRGSA
jgi:hypothetical protein